MMKVRARWIAAASVIAALACAAGCGDDEGSSSSGGGEGGSAATSGTSGSGTTQPSGAGSTGAGASGAGSTGAGGTGSSTGATSSSGSASTTSTGSSSSGDFLSDRYPGDVGIGDDPAVLFHDDFESGWGRWDAPQADTEYLHMEQGDLANAGTGYLRSTVTRQHLQETQYISSQSSYDFAERVDRMFVRFYARFPEVAPNPHHWVRFAAGTEAFDSSGLANTVPAGDQGFWFDFDISNDDVFNFYAYWHAMRSGRCNDGSATPGCEGDQGTTYYYGNVFRPRDQVPFTRDEWFCIEIDATANTVGQTDGALAFYVDDAPIGDYGPGRPDGTWLRESFHEGGCEFSACTDPVPFEGFDFRTSADVRFKKIVLDAYYERGSSEDKRAELEARGLTPSDSQTIFYDDVVVATERIGCRR